MTVRQRTAYQSRQPRPDGKVEPDDGVGRTRDEVPDLAPTHPADHPRLEADHGLQSVTEHVGGTSLSPSQASVSASTRGTSSRVATARPRVVFPLAGALDVIAIRRGTTVRVCTPALPTLFASVFIAFLVVAVILFVVRYFV